MNQDTQPDLSHIGLLCVAGIDAKKLLQGQLTCHLDEVTETEFRLGAHCNPQGRMLSLFRIFLFNENYYLQMPRESVPFALAALKKYAIFFKVSLTDASDQILQNEALKQKLITLLSPDEKIFSEIAWKKSNIAAGIPEIYPDTIEKFLPHDINLPGLNGVSFNKGCFTGQEIIARMQYRGKLKTHLYSAKTNTQAMPVRGDEIYTEEGPAGHIVDFVELGYNNYALLVTAKENEIESKHFFLDTNKTIPLEIESWQKN